MIDLAFLPLDDAKSGLQLLREEELEETKELLLYLEQIQVVWVLPKDHAQRRGVTFYSVKYRHYFIRNYGTYTMQYWKTIRKRRTFMQSWNYNNSTSKFKHVSTISDWIIERRKINHWVVFFSYKKLMIIKKFCFLLNCICVRTLSKMFYSCNNGFPMNYLVRKDEAFTCAQDLLI